MKKEGVCECYLAESIYDKEAKVRILECLPRRLDLSEVIGVLGRLVPVKQRITTL